MKSTRFSGLAALLMLAGGAQPSLFSTSGYRQPIGKGAKQARQKLAHLCQPELIHASARRGTYYARGLKQRQRKERRSGATTARQQRKLRQVIRNANRAALAKAFPAEQA